MKSLPETFPSTVRCGVSFPFVSMAALKARRFGGVFANRASPNGLCHSARLGDEMVGNPTVMTHCN